MRPIPHRRRSKMTVGDWGYLAWNLFVIVACILGPLILMSSAGYLLSALALGTWNIFTVESYWSGVIFRCVFGLFTFVGVCSSILVAFKTFGDN